MDVETSTQRTADAYNSMYRKPNYFGYGRWLYRPFLAALVKKAGLRPRSTLLDAGCGQGFFAALLSELGFTVTGVDVSAAGIEAANTRSETKRRALELGTSCRCHATLPSIVSIVVAARFTTSMTYSDYTP